MSDSIKILALAFVFIIAITIRGIINNVRMKKQVKTIDCIRVKRKPKIHWIVDILLMFFLIYAVYNIYKYASSLPGLEKLAGTDDLAEAYREQNWMTREEVLSLIENYKKRIANYYLVVITITAWAVYEIIYIVNGRCMYISDVGVYAAGRFITADNFLYRFTDIPNCESLMLIYFGTVKVEMLTVIDDKERLKQILANNYKYHQ